MLKRWRKFGEMFLAILFLINSVSSDVSVIAAPIENYNSANLSKSPINFRDSKDTRVNLALNQPVTYSGVEGDKSNGKWKYPQFAGEKVVDGDESTRWSAGKTDDQWLTIDLGKAQKVSEIQLLFHAESPSYQVLVSSDGKNFNSVYNMEKGTQGQKTQRVIIFNSITARYIKYQQNKMWLNPGNNQYYGSSLYEIKAFAESRSVKSLTFDQTAQKLSVGYSKVLNYHADTADLKPAADKLIWTSSDPSVASVEKGQVKGLKAGTTIITAQIPETSIKATMELIVQTNRPEYTAMRQKWRERLIATKPDLSDPNVKKYLTDLAKQSDELWESMDRSASRKRIWAQKSSDTVSADYTTTFTNIKILTLGYYNPLSNQYQQPEVYKAIIDALNFMVDNKKYNGSYSTGNWWDWQIGSAQQLDDILILLNDDLVKQNHDQLIKFVKPLLGYDRDPNVRWPSAVATGANLTDISISVLATAILLEDDQRMALVKDNLPKAMQLVTQGEGIYADGSFIQHIGIPYNGSYGNEMIKGIARISSLLVNTQWAISEEQFKNIANFIDQGFLQLMVEGRMPSMVSGRSISRAPGTNPETTELETGKETIANLTLIADALPQSLKDKVNQSVAVWVKQIGTRYNFFDNPRDYAAITGLKNALATAKALDADFTSLNIYASMDRVMQKASNYAAGISMYSSRVSNYESINGENKHAWHTADGMFYLYNDDLNQFGEGYWATVDPYRLPGTTVDTQKLNDGAQQSKKSPQKWVGGATDGAIASVGMALDKSNQGQDLSALKSWFLLNGQIVNLGTKIQGNTSADIETILDQRQITPESDQLWQDGKIASSFPTTINKWFNIQEPNTKNNVGYILGKTNDPVLVTKNTRQGSYKNINPLFPSDKIYQHTYVTLAALHGSQVNNGKYEYVVVPGASNEKIAQLAAKPDYQVLFNNSDVQAIKTSDQIMANVWSKVEDLGGLFSTNSACSVIIKNLGANNYQITVSDPTQKDGTVKLSFNYPIALTTKTSDFTVSGQDLLFKTNGLAGKSKSVKVSLNIPVDKSKLIDTIKKAQQIKEDTYTAQSYSKLKTALQQAIVIKDQDNTSQNVVDVSNSNLEKAINELVKIADITDLKQQIAKAEKLNEQDYTSNSWETLRKALETGVQVVSQVDNFSQKEVDNATEAIKTALNNLVKQSSSQLPNDPVDPSLPVVDKNELKALIDQAQQVINQSAKYPLETINQIKQEILEAQKIVNDVNASAKDVSTAASSLQDILNKLKPIDPTTSQVDLTALRQSLKIYDDLVSKFEIYTKSSVTNYKNAAKKARELLKQSKITQNDVDKVTKLLNNAYENLTKIWDYQKVQQIGYIDYEPGYGINVYREPAKQFTGQRLSHGSAWKISGIATHYDGIKYYRVGSNQWIDSQYVTFKPIYFKPLTGVIKINYVPGYGVNIWQDATTNCDYDHHRKLLTNTKWRVKGIQNGFYYVGKNQWVDAIYAVYSR